MENSVTQHSRLSGSNTDQNRQKPISLDKSAVIKVNDTMCVVSGPSDKMIELQSKSTQILKRQYNAIVAENEKLSATLNAFMEELKQLKTQINYKDMTIEELKQRLLQDERVYKVNLATFEDKEQLQEAVLQQMGEENEALKAELQRLQLRICDEEVIKNQLAESVEQLKQQVQSMAAVQGEHNQTETALRSQLAAKDSRIESLQQQLKDAQMKKANYHTLIQQLNRQDEDISLSRWPWWFTALVGVIATTAVVLIGSL